MSVLRQGSRRPAHAAGEGERSRARRGRRGRGREQRRLDLEGTYALDSRPKAGGAATAERRDEGQRRLEEVMLTTWAALLAGHPVECPVCGGPLTAAHGCRSCGSRLS